MMYNDVDVNDAIKGTGRRSIHVVAAVCSVGGRGSMGIGSRRRGGRVGASSGCGGGKESGKSGVGGYGKYNWVESDS